MNSLQTRLEVQGATQQWVDSFMLQYGISPSMMEDALTKVLCNLKDKVVIELLSAAAAEQPPQEEEKDAE
jgi:hypothetical protein